MSFSHIVGLEQPVAVLRRAIVAERVSHAYLLHGPANIGKTLLAHEFAKAVNCETNTAIDSVESVDPCDECSACRRIDQGSHPDIRAIRPMAKVQAEDEEGGADVVIEGAMITTEQVGHLVTEASLKASQARRKVFIISSAEAMNPTAANRLLKTLEEPPPSTTLVLTTQNLSRLLPTIISRCQMVKCHPAPPAVAEEGLRTRFPDADPGALRSMVALSGGRVGWAIRLLDHPETLELRDRLLDAAASLPARDWFEGMAVGEGLIGAAEEWWLATEDAEFAEKALKASPDRVRRTKMNDVLDVLLTWFRDLSLLAAGGNVELVINADRGDELAAIARERQPARVQRACGDIEEARAQIRGNANLRLAAEVLAFKLIRACR